MTFDGGLVARFTPPAPPLRSVQVTVYADTTHGARGGRLLNLECDREGNWSMPHQDQLNRLGAMLWNPATTSVTLADPYPVEYHDDQWAEKEAGDS